MFRSRTFFKKLNGHFGVDAATLPIVNLKLLSFDRANAHIAIEELGKKADEAPVLYGVHTAEEYRSVTLASLANPSSSTNYDLGPVEYIDEQISIDASLACVKQGLYLFRLAGQPIAMLVRDDRYSSGGFGIEVMAKEKEKAEEVTAQLKRLIRHGTIFRGKVLSVEKDCYGNASVIFHKLPEIQRENVILPAELLNRIERHTVAFSQQASRLKSVGRHLKRGLLLYGPPGTGKTYTAMYLTSRMPGRTVFLLTGGGIGAIEAVCSMARVLEPSTIILEDVDLIATQRSSQTVSANSLLFELLNQMDGLAEDADILFVLTTNHPEVLEEALAARPGRIDQAIEVPKPDFACRKRLFELYANGLTLNLQNLDGIIQRIDGVSASFIRELLRKSAVYAALDSDETLVVTDRHIDEALSDLLVVGGPLTQNLLGAGSVTA